jgi:cell division protein FtsI/penicillin-binding protein 2
MHRSPGSWFTLIGFAVFAAVGLWQFAVFQSRSVEDFYQPSGYIDKVNKMIQEGKIFYEQKRDSSGYHPEIRTAKLEPEDQLFYEGSWLKEDIEAFNDGNSDVFLIDKGWLRGVNIYRHRIESPLASDWNWWGRIYSQSSEGYAYLWNMRRTLKLYRPPLEERASAKIGQSEFREVIYGKGHLFQTGLGISLKNRYGNRLADVYSMGDNIVLKSYSQQACAIDGHVVSKGQEQRLEEGDLVQIYFDPGEREEFLFHDFSRKPLSFVNVTNGRVNRTNLDNSFHFIQQLAAGIETAVKKSKKEKKVEFDVHLALDEDLAGLTQTTIANYAKQLSSAPMRASCTIMETTTGRILATASVGKKPDDLNENFKLHPVGSSTKIFLAAAASQNYPDLLSLELGPHAPGEEKNLLGYELKEGYKLRPHAPYVGEAGTTDFPGYIAKSCNRFHAVLMTLSLAKDNVIATGKQQQENLFSGIALTDSGIDRSNGEIYLEGKTLDRKPDLSYFVSPRSDGTLECTNLESSELALNMERLFDVKRKYYEGSGDFFSPEPWNVLFARLGLEQRQDLYPAFYSIMPQTVNLGLNLNIDFRLDFISLIFGGATNRWNNIRLAEATSRLVTNQKVRAHFVEKITENGRELKEPVSVEPLGLNPAVHEQLLRGMEAVSAPGGTAGDLYPLLQSLKEKASSRYTLEFYGKTGTPFRKEIRLGQKEIYSSVFLFTALLRNTETSKVEDGLTFAVYVEDQGEHKAVDLLKLILPRLLAARRWVG